MNREEAQAKEQYRATSAHPPLSLTHPHQHTPRAGCKVHEREEI